MNTQIASLILSRIRTADFPWAEKTAGLVRAISTKAKKGGGKTDILPIAADVLGSADCEPSAIDHLLPDQRYRSILFIECSEFPTRKDERIGSPSWAGKYRIIVWMDCSRVGGGAGCGDVAYENLVTALDVPMFDADPFRAVVFRVVGGGPARGREIFGKYTMNEERSQYLHYPFDYFALDLQVDFVLPKGCEDQLAEDNVNCWEPPSSSGPTPSANQPCPPIRTCDTPEDGDVLTRVDGETVWAPPSGGGGGGGGVTDHGALTGLGDDDHTQYHNNARGDARYYTQAQVDTALSGKANTSHTHAISDVTGLQTALDGKAASDHSHAIDDVTGLQTALDAKASTASLATLITEDPGAGVGMIESGAGVTPYVLKNIKDGNGTTVTNNTGSIQIDIGSGAISNAMLANGAVANLSGTNTGDQDLSGLAVKSNNLSDLTSASTARTNLGLGTLATQSGTFSGTSSGTNTGDQDLSSYATTAAVAAAYEPKSKNVKVSNFTFNSATYTDLTGAAVTLDASTTYQVRAIVTYTCPTSATGIGLSVTMTGSPTARNLNRAQPVAATGTVVVQIPTDDAGAIATGSTGTTQLVAVLDGNVLTSGSSCTMQLRVARGGTSATITILSATIIAHPL